MSEREQELIERMARAIKVADKERPFGLYDYSKYPDPNASPPHVVRDEKTGEGVLRSHNPDEASALFDRLTEEYVGRAALSVLREAIPGIDLLIAGTGVVVPVEPTDAMFFDPDDVCVNTGQSAWEAFCEIYRAMIEAAKDTRHD